MCGILFCDLLYSTEQQVLDKFKNIKHRGPDAKYTTSIIGEYKMFRDGIEKKILRDSVRKQLPELTMSRIIDRQKERFSDGCGFSYVPDILNYMYNNQIENKKCITLGDKEDAERKYHMQNFNKYFAGLEHLIIKRELPKWCDTSTQNHKLID
jgi:hypothetical protein